MKLCEELRFSLCSLLCLLVETVYVSTCAIVPHSSSSHIHINIALICLIQIFKSMQIWRENVNYIKAQQRATAEVNQALTRAAMVFWRDYHVYESIK